MAEFDRIQAENTRLLAENEKLLKNQTDDMKIKIQSPGILPFTLHNDYVISYDS